MDQTEQPGEVTVQLREREIFVEEKLRWFLANTTFLEKQIATWNQNISFISEASNIFLGYISTGKLENIVLSPYVASGVREESYMFNQALEIHGFALSAIKDGEISIESVLVVDLRIISQKKTGFGQRIQSWWRRNKQGTLMKKRNHTTTRLKYNH